MSGEIEAEVAAFHKARRDHEAAKAKAADLYWVAAGAGETLRKVIADEMGLSPTDSEVMSRAQRLVIPVRHE